MESKGLFYKTSVNSGTLWLCGIYLLVLFLITPHLNLSFAQEGSENKTEIAGEFFGTPVPIGNYYFAKGAIMVFGNQWGPQPTTAEELENCVWDELLLSYEAFRRDIQVSQQELEEEITKTVEAEKVDFDWKKDKDAYNKWVKERANEPAELFENQLKHLIQLNKLRQQIMDNLEPQVREDEAEQEFLNEHNTLGIELVQFDEKKDAEDFYKKLKSKPDFWEEEKNKRPQDFKRPGFVALEFLMDMWKLPKETVYKMMDMEIGSIHQPAPIYKGYGVFKVLEKRPSDKTLYPQLMNSYQEQLKLKKKYEGLNEWFKDLKERANIKRFLPRP